MAKEDLTLNIKADVRKATAEIKKINKTLEEFKKEQQKIAKESLNSAKSIENFTNRLTQMAHVTAGLAGLDMTLGKIIEVGEEFEKSISKLGAISKASSEDLENLKDKAKELGMTTQYSAKQVADAMNYEAMAGMKTNEILTATKDILDLASVGQMDLAQASDIATDTMSAFGMSADEVKKIVDVMSVTITNSNTNVEQLGEAFKNVAPVAHNLGLSIEQTSAMLGVLADSGRKGGEAGTHLKIILQRLSSTTKPVVEGLERLGLSAYDSNGKLKPLTTTLKNIKSKLDTLNEQQRNEILKDLFGEEAIASANIILNNLDSMDDKLKKITNSTGEAAKMAEKMNDNLAGDKQKLNSALESLANNIYETLLPSLREATQALTEFVTYLAEHDEEVIEIIKDVLELATTFYGLKKAIEVVSFLKTAKEILQAKNNFDLIVKSVKNFTNAIGLITKANPILLTLTAVISGLVMEWNHLIAAEQKQIEITDNLNKNTKQFSEVIQELYSKHLNKATKELELTNKEQEKYKKNIDELIASTKKQLEVAKQNSDGSDEYKNIISQLEQRLKLLKKAEEDINSAKILQKQQEATQNTTKQTQAVKLLTKEQEKYIKSLDDELKKQTQKKQTLSDWYDAEMANLEKILKGTKEYYKAKETLEKIYKQKQKEQREKELQEILDSTKRNYEQRAKEHENLIEKLQHKEKDLANRIIDIQKDLQNKLKQIEQNRINAIEDIEDKIHNIQISGLSDYKKYVDKKEQAEIKLSKAKEALKKGELDQAKRYMGQYESLVTSLANTEIKENGKVLVSKKQSNQETIKGLKTLEELTSNYYAKQKAQEIEAHNQKIQQLKAELTATKAQIQLEVERLKLEKQIVEALTGQEIDIDTTSALNSIREIDEQIKNLDEKLKNPKKVEVDADTKEAQNNINNIKESTQNTKTTLKVSADTKEAQGYIFEISDYVTGETRIFKVDADTQKAQEKTKELEKQIDATTPTIQVNSDISKALDKLNQIPKTITTTHIIKTIEQKATGGKIGAIRLASGGDVNFERKQGRIPGYDPSDSDDVPALLTRGEFVIKRDAVKHYGDDFLYKLNNKMLPKFATGGLVEQGTPQKLVTELKNDIDNNNFKEEISLDTSKLDEYLEKLDELLSTLSLGGANRFTNEIKSEIDKIQKTKDKITKDEDKYTKDTQKLEDYKESIKGKTLSQKEFETYKTKTSKLSEIIKKDETKITDIDANKVEMLEKELNDFINKIDVYLKEVEIVKDKIQAKLSTLNIDTNLFPDLQSNLDLDRLNNFYHKISSLKMLDESQINAKYSTMIQRFVDNARQKYYSPAGFSTNAFMLPKPPNAWGFLKSLGINDRNLVAKINNLIQMVDFREYGKEYKLSEDITKEIKTDYLKQHLPKFQNGGIIALQNGGKLSGYGGGDRNLALLEDGEFVIRKEAVKNYGANFLHSLNNIKLPKFQVGGMVDFNSLPKFQNGGEVSSGYTANINFTMPSGKSYSMSSTEDVAKALSQEFRRM